MRRIEVRRATELDCEGALRLMAELELIHSAISLRNLWVVAEGGAVVGAAHIEPLPAGAFLSGVGIAPGHRHMGLGRRLIETMLRETEADVYLYTVIPEFFQKLGFAECAPPEGLPPRDIFGCDRCEPVRCRCMKRQANL